MITSKNLATDRYEVRIIDAQHQIAKDARRLATRLEEFTKSFAKMADADSAHTQSILSEMQFLQSVVATVQLSMQSEAAKIESNSAVVRALNELTKETANPEAAKKPCRQGTCLGNF